MSGRKSSSNRQFPGFIEARARLAEELIALLGFKLVTADKHLTAGHGFAILANR